MNWKNTASRYGSLSIGIHWLMLLLFIAVYGCIELRSFYPKAGHPRGIEDLALHARHAGFFADLAASAARLSGPAPGIRPEPPAWQQLSAKLIIWRSMY